LTQIMESLLMRLSHKGVSPDRVPWLIRDVLSGVGSGKETSAAMLNRRLAILGWEEEILDETTLALILFLAAQHEKRRIEHHL
jgi:hypothetical protein